MKMVIPHPLTPDLTDYPYHVFRTRTGPIIAHVLGHTGPMTHYPSVNGNDPATTVNEANAKAVQDDLSAITALPVIPHPDGVAYLPITEAESGDLLTNTMDLLPFDKFRNTLDPETYLTRIAKLALDYGTLDRTFTDARLEVRSLSDVYDHLGAGFIQWAEHFDIPLQSAALLAVQAYPQVFVVPRAPTNGWKGLIPAAKDLLDANINPCTATALGVTDAEFHPEDGTLSLYVSMDDRRRERKTRMKAGKALRKAGVSTNDERIKRLASDIKGALTPPEFHIGFTKADFDEAYTNGPNSCMTYKNDQYHMVKHMIERGVEGAENLRPTDALINGDIGVATMRAGDKITSRALVVHSTGAWVRIYAADYANRKNGSEALKQHLHEAGYHEDKRGLCNQHLVKIEVPDWESNNPFLKDMFDLPNGFLEREAGRINSRLTSEFEAEYRDKAQLKAYLMPYIDWNNHPVIDEGDTLRVASPRETDLLAGASVPANAIINARDNEQVLEKGTFGQCHYQTGGAVITNVQAVNTWLDELRTANRQTPQTPQPPQPDQPTQNTDDRPAPNETVGQWLSRLVREQRAQPTEPPTAEPTAAYGSRQRLDDILNSRDPDDDREDEDHYQPLLTSGCAVPDESINEAEAEELFGEAVASLAVPSEPDLIVWAPVSRIRETEDEERDYVPDYEGLFEVVDCPGYGPFCEDNTVVLDNGDHCPRDHARYSEREQEWFDEDDVVWSEPCDDWIRDSDAVRDVTGEYIPDDEAYRLPNGDYVHEDDLQRA